MKCPSCQNRTQVDIHEADGYSQDSRECGICGCVWTFHENQRVIIKEGKTLLLENN